MKTANTEPELTLRLDDTMPARVSAIDEAMDRIMTTVRHARCVSEHEHDIDLAVREAIAETRGSITSKTMTSYDRARAKSRPSAPSPAIAVT